VIIEGIDAPSVFLIKWRGVDVATCYSVREVEEYKRRSLETNGNLDGITVEYRENTRPCSECGAFVTSTNPEVDFCRNCFYAGVGVSREHDALLASLRALPEVDAAEVWHTGGGCFMLAITLANARLLTCTVALSDPDYREGEWFCDASLPDHGEPWYAFEWESLEAHDAATETGEYEDAAVAHAPLSDSDLLNLCRERGV